MQVEFNCIQEYKCIAEFTRNMIPNGALMIAIIAWYKIVTAVVPHIYKLKEHYIKVIVISKLIFSLFTEALLE